MAQVAVDVDAAPEVVWDVLADPSAYGDWVVGTKQVVRADEEWPAPGTELEYELGAGPITVGDRTTVVESDPPRLLVLRAQLQRLGAAAIRIELRPQGSGTHVVMDEAPVEGAMDALHTPVSDAALKQRNEVALDRLKRIAEERAHGRG